MSFDSPAAGPGPRWTGDGSLRPRVTAPAEALSSPASRTHLDAAPARRTVEVGGHVELLSAPWRRACGYAVDFLIRATLFAVVLAVAGANSGAFTPELLVAGQIFSRGWDLIFFPRGWTPGSRLMGMRIVRLADGGPPGLRWGVMRAAGAVLSETVFFLGHLWGLWDGRVQTWQDKLARTVVVDRRRAD